MKPGRFRLRQCGAVRGISAAMKPSQWLCTNNGAVKDAGAEEDLSKAFDKLSHEVLDIAFHHINLPVAVRNSLAKQYAPRTEFRKVILARQRPLSRF